MQNVTLCFTLLHMPCDPKVSAAATRARAEAHRGLVAWHQARFGEADYYGLLGDGSRAAVECKTASGPSGAVGRIVSWFESAFSSKMAGEEFSNQLAKLVKDDRLDKNENLWHLFHELSQQSLTPEPEKGFLELLFPATDAASPADRYESVLSNKAIEDAWAEVLSSFREDAVVTRDEVVQRLRQLLLAALSSRVVRARRRKRAQGAASTWSRLSTFDFRSGNPPPLGNRDLVVPTVPGFQTRGDSNGEIPGFTQCEGLSRRVRVRDSEARGSSRKVAGIPALCSA